MLVVIDDPGRRCVAAPPLRFPRWSGGRPVAERVLRTWAWLPRRSRTSRTRLRCPDERSAPTHPVPRLQKAMALKAAAYAAFRWLHPIAGMVASPDLAVARRVRSVVFSGIAAGGRDLPQEPSPRAAISADVEPPAAGTVAVVCLAVAQIVMIAVTVINRSG